METITNIDSRTLEQFLKDRLSAHNDGFISLNLAPVVNKQEDFCLEFFHGINLRLSDLFVCVSDYFIRRGYKVEKIWPDCSGLAATKPGEEICVNMTSFARKIRVTIFKYS